MNESEKSILESEFFGERQEAAPNVQNQGSGSVVLDELAIAFLIEQRRSRRWKIFFRLIALLIVLLLLLSSFYGADPSKPFCVSSCTALVKLEGEIASDSDASAEHINAALRDAFGSEYVRGVILEINSPGGSPVQAGKIYDEIKRLREQYPHIPIYTVVDEMAASGGYYVAAASDDIYVDKASLVGSIGVIMMNFGFTGAMEKLGIEQRTMTSGENKAFMDPFSPENDEQKSHMQGLLDNVHHQFIDAVRKGRGERLHETESIFSGLIWDGENSVRLGLADGFGSVESVARDVIGEENIRDFSYYPDFSERLARQFGVAFAEYWATRTAGNTIRWR
ncbi:MAG: S49 family peptidase [Burkholderiales bacterium]|nr:S49 family peptidase [Burkholderiales bacterium]